jgi:hypothetical protein
MWLVLWDSELRVRQLSGIWGLTLSGTDNELSGEEAYHHIMVLLPIQQ